MQNPYDVNTNASNALLGGAAADNALGFPNPRPQAGMRTGSDMIAGAKARLDALRAQRTPTPQPAVFGYNPESHTFFSGGKTWSGDNLSEVDGYDKAGYFDLDNSGKLPEGYAPVTADYVRAWKEKKASERGFMSAAGETLSAVGRGIPDIINMGVQAAAMNAPAGSWLEQSLGDAASEYQRTSTTPDVYGRGETAQSFIRAGQAIPASVAAGAASVVAPVVGTGAAGYVMGSAQAWDTYQRGLAAGLTPEAAKAAAMKTGTIEGVGETLADAAAARLLPGAGKALTGMMRGIAPAGYGKRVAIDLLANAGVQSGTEFAQGYGQAAVEKDAGISTQDPFEVGSEGFKTGLAMSALMAPFGVAAGVANRPQVIPPAPTQPAAPAAPVPPPSLDATAPVGTQGELLDAQQGPMQPAPLATPESYQEKVASLAELTSMLPEAQEVGGEYLQDLQAQIRAVAAELVALGDNTQNQRGVMSGVNEVVSGVPTELTNDELVSGAIPMVDAGFDPQANLFNFDQPTAQEGLAFEPTELPTVESQQAPKRKTNLTPDEMSYEGQPVAFSNTDYQPSDTSAYSETKLTSAINPKGRLKKRMVGLVKELYAATSKWNDKAIDTALRKIEKADPDIFMAADQLVANMRQERTNNLARQGQDRGQPGQAVGPLPAKKTDTVAQMRAQSQQTLADETAPDYTPNEMDPGLVKEKGPKGPASTLALRGQTQADLDALNTREQWLAGPQENTGPAAVPANQLAMFDLKGQPTNPAMGVPLPKSEKPEASAQKRGPKSRKPTDPKADQRTAPSSAPVASEPSRVSTDRKAPVVPAEKPVAAPVVRAEAVNADLTANVPEGPLDPMQRRMMDRIDAAYEADQIDAADIAPLQELVRAGRVPQARARLSELAVSNVGAGRAKFRRGGRKAGPMTLQEVLATVTEMVRGWTQGVVVKVVADPSELPQAVQDQMKRDGATDAKGAYSGGTVYVIASAQTSTQDVVETVLHELAGHHGLRGVLGDKFAATMEKIYTDNGPVRTRADAKMATGLDKVTAVEEVLSEMQEGKSQPRNRSPWRAVVIAFKRILDKMFGAEFSDIRVEALLDRALEWTQSGTGPVPSSRFAQFRSNAVAPKLPEPLREVSTNIGETLRAWGQSTLNVGSFTEDLISRAFSKGITSVKAYDEAQRRRASKVGERERDAIAVLEPFKDLPSSQQKLANQYIYESTRTGAWGYDPKIAGVSVNPTMAASYRAMGKDAQAFVRSVFSHGAKSLADKQAMVKAAVDSEYAADLKAANATGQTALAEELEDAKKAALSKFNALFSANEGSPYAPLRRDGDWLVVGTSPEYDAAPASEQAKMQTQSRHYHVSFVDNESEARAAAKELSAEGMNATHRPKEAMLEEMYGGKGVIGSLFKVKGQLERTAAMSTSKEDTAAINQLRRMVADMYLQALADTSARKSEMRRKGIAGDIDMVKAFGLQANADAQFMASVEFNKPIADAITEMREQAKSGADAAEKMKLFNELMRRQVESQTHVEQTVADRVTRVTSIVMLATSPAYYLTNASQPFVISVPFMAKDHTWFSAASAMTKAWGEVFGLMKNTKWRHTLGMDNVPADVRAAMDNLVKLGVLDIGMSSEMGSFQIADKNAVSKTWNKVDDALRIIAQKVEMVNRLATAIASYRLEMSRSGNAAAAEEYARTVVTQTHGDYSRANAPRVFNSSLGRVALQFRKFQLIQITMMSKLVKDAFAGATAAEKLAARRGLGFVFAHVGVLGGMVALPGYAVWGALAAAMLGADGPDDLEEELRKAVGNKFVADLLTRGVPTMGGADISGRIGWTNMLSVLPFTDVDFTSRKSVTEIGFALTLGASGGMLLRGADSMKYMSQGDYYRGVEAVMPSLIMNTMKAARFATRGVTKPDGDVLVKPEEMSPLADIGTALGFTPLQTTRRNETTSREYAIKAYFNDRSSTLKRQYVEAVRSGKGVTRVVDDWKAMQENQRARGIRPSSIALLYRAPVEARRRESNTVAGVQYTPANMERAKAEEAAE